MKLLAVCVCVVVLCGVFREAAAWGDWMNPPDFADWDDSREEHSNFNGCDCHGISCHCCVGIKIGILNPKGCVNVEYSKPDAKLTVQVKVARSTIIEESISLKEPSWSACKGFRGYKVCCGLGGIQVSPTHIRACALFRLKLFGLQILNKDTGCFTINLMDSN